MADINKAYEEILNERCISFKRESPYENKDNTYHLCISPYKEHSNIKGIRLKLERVLDSTNVPQITYHLEEKIIKYEDNSKDLLEDMAYSIAAFSLPIMGIGMAAYHYVKEKNKPSNKLNYDLLTNQYIAALGNLQHHLTTQDPKKKPSLDKIIEDNKAELNEIYKVYKHLAYPEKLSRTKKLIISSIIGALFWSGAYYFSLKEDHTHKELQKMIQPAIGGVVGYANLLKHHLKQTSPPIKK